MPGGGRGDGSVVLGMVVSGGSVAEMTVPGGGVDDGVWGRCRGKWCVVEVWMWSLRCPVERMVSVWQVEPAP